MWDWLKNLFRAQEPSKVEEPKFGGAGASGAWESAVAVKKPPRGIRNNNPGNLRGGNIPWRGEVGRDPEGFVIFRDSTHGIRAMAKVLMTYHNVWKLRTVRSVITRWAPATENNTNAYVRAVAKTLGVGENQTINVLFRPVMFELVKAIIRHENGSNPYSDAEIYAGIDMALIV